MKYTYCDLAEETLQKAGMPLSTDEIWQKAVEFELTKKLDSIGKTPSATIGARVYVDMRDNPASKFCKVGNKPTRFALKTFSLDEQNRQMPVEIKKKTTFSERDLHPLLSAYVYSDAHFKCQTKTIFHEKSLRAPKGQNQWLHPDIVGVYFPFSDYEQSTISIIKSMSESAIKLFSFEMKKTINFANLREYFFQAVSNSSWAHEGYLVAFEYENNSDLMDEMRRLNNSFGIGFIKLDAENVEQSEIIIAAITKTNVDWETVNRLVEENQDFKEFVDSVIDDNQVGKIRGKYDKVLEPDDLEHYVKTKGILE